MRRRRNPTDVLETHPLATVPDITVRLEWDEETKNWMSFVPELGNISTFGRTQEQALDATAEMILVYLDDMQDRRMRVPISAAAVRRLRQVLA